MATIRKVYLTNPNFKPEIVAKASSAAEGLCKWVIALDSYDVVVKEVAPKKAKLEIAEAEFSQTMAVLNAKRAQVAALEAKLASLNRQLEEAQARKQALEDDVNACTAKLIKAEKLIGGLGGEKHRWIAAAGKLQESYDTIAGDILVSCAIIAYLAPFTSFYRLSRIEDWKRLCVELNIPLSDEYSMIQVLGSDIKIQGWNIHGLPNDAFSVDNAIILDASQRWSLCIDPQSQANKWIKSMEKENKLQVVKLSDGNYMKLLEICVEYGKPMLIENIQEDLDAPLDPVIMKQTFRQGNQEYIALGDNIMSYSPKFRLYMTSKLRNPHYLPEVFNKVTIINFALTVEGLEDQLLGIAVAKERPDLQETREKLIIEGARDKRQLKEVEDSILYTLSSIKGNILENETAIDILDASKHLAKEIITQQEAAKETTIIIDTFRQGYRPIAQHAAVLYYCIADLPNVDPMYQYSLVWFINIFIFSIENSTKAKDLEGRIRNIINCFTYNLYQNVCRSLFEKDKTLFSFILCTSIMIAENRLTREELMFLMTGGVGLENKLANPSPNWLSNKSWDEICLLNELPMFNGFLNSFRENIEEWHSFYDLTDPHLATLPEPWESKLTLFQKLVIVRVFRADKVINLILRLVEFDLGSKFTKPPPFDIQKSYEDSNCLSPLIFILSPGIDPMQSLIQFAVNKEFADRFQSISLGQGQGPIALRMIQEAQRVGRWVCLQNCHLAVSWMSTLEKICENFDKSNTTPDFRLWLTSYPSDQFPASILQDGVKMTNEPPTGLQQNLLRSYTSDPVRQPDFFSGCPDKQKPFTLLLFGISFFHAVVQERRNFGPIGWNIPYGFNESDYHISIRQLQMYINEYDDVPYDAILYLTGECNYGGRVTDDWDRRTLNTLLHGFCSPELVTDNKFQFCSIDEVYRAPMFFQMDDYITRIKELPSITPPEVFGLHMNAGISRDLQNTKGLFDTLLLVQGQGSGGEGSSDKLLMIIASDILAKLPETFDLEEATERFPVSYQESMNTVLVQELERFNKLLVVIRSTLVQFLKAIKGIAVMSPQLEAIANSLLIARTPAQWAKASYPSLKPLGGYVADFLERIAFLRSWVDLGKPLNFWLSGFYFTQAFLTGAMQNFARRYTVPIDLLTFDFELLTSDRTDEPPEDGVYVYGMFMDGARWDRNSHSISEQRPKVLYDRMPLIWFKPHKKAELKVGTRYVCPLYKTSERKGILSTTGHSTNYVLPILLDTAVRADHWVKRGVALLCQLDD